MSDTEICYLPATEALRRFRSRDLSPVEFLEAQIRRAEEVGSQVNALAFAYTDEALEAAKAAETIYAKSPEAARPLEGIPLAAKDENAIKGKITTYGSLIYKDAVATSTTPTLERLMGAGAIVHARTTTPEFSSQGFTHSRLWGVTRNPWNLDFTPGGSSGGSGAALAAGMATLATGSDIGGSIRIPASASGVVGYKPPYGRNPTTPPFNMDFYNHAGPMARTVEDCLLMQNLMSGPHPRDIASLRPKIEVPIDRSGIKGMRVAYSIDLGYFPVDENVRRNTMTALQVLRDLGAVVEEVDLGWTVESGKAANDYLATIFGAWVSEYMDERQSLLTDYNVAFAKASQNTTARGFLRSLEVAGSMYDTFGPMMENYDIFVCPTLAIPAVPADFNPADGLKINGIDVDPAFGWVMTYPFNMLSRCPVLSVPSGRADNGVPTGIQIVGPTYDDASVFRAGLAFETAVGGWYKDAASRPMTAN